MNASAAAIPGFSISSDRSRLQIERIHRFLSEEAYWSLGIPRAVIERAVEGSLCFGVYENASAAQVGFARVVTDQATFAWICDVYVEAAFRGRGLSKMLVAEIIAHPGLQGLRRICLATKDAHRLYAGFGFEVTKTPGNWMEIRPASPYGHAQNGAPT